MTALNVYNLLLHFNSLGTLEILGSYPETLLHFPACRTSGLLFALVFQDKCREHHVVITALTISIYLSLEFPVHLMTPVKLRKLSNVSPARQNLW